MDNYCDMFYKLSKPKYTKAYREVMIYVQLFNILMTKFQYNDLPETIPPELLEGLAISEGICGVGNIDGKPYVGTGGYCGDIVNGFLPGEYAGSAQGVGNFRGVAGEEVAVLWNNASRAPDLDLIDTSIALTETITSEGINVLFSRLLRIPIAKDERERKIIEDAIKAIIQGNIQAISSSLKLGDIIGEKSVDQSGKFLDLVDIKDVDKLQYLNQYYDNRLKRFLQWHGVPLQITAKLAQQTTQEIHGADNYSMIYTMHQLEYRKRFIDDLNRIFGCNATVELSPVWKESYDRFFTFQGDEQNEEGVIDNGNIENGTADGDNTGDLDEPK